MSHHKNEKGRARRAMIILTGYPLSLFLVALPVNLFVFDVGPATIALPSLWCIRALAVSAILLVVNHTWIMTATELTRARFKMVSTPEDRPARDAGPEDAPTEGTDELRRSHNAHRNTTENTVHFALLAFVFVLTSPSPGAAISWLVGFASARLGYTYSYLSGLSGARGLFMTLGLLALYGMASHLALGLFFGANGD